MSVTAAALLGAAAAPSSAVVGGNDASPGEYPSVAEITFGPFLCTGTLITPDWVLTAGHCSNVTGAAVATPASWPPPLINVRVGGVTQNDGEQRGVSRVVMHPDYLLTSGYDISLLQLSSSSTMAPTQVAGAGERSIWTAGTLETIVGWGATEEGGDLPDHLQEAQVPITTDAYCAGAYSDFDPRRWSAPGSPRAASTPARATRAARCSGARPPARCGWWAPRASARAARGPASRASTAAWRTTRCGRGSPRTPRAA